LTNLYLTIIYLSIDLI